MKHLKPECSCGAKMKLHSSGPADLSTFRKDVKQNYRIDRDVDKHTWQVTCTRVLTSKRIRYIRKPAPSVHHIRFKCTHHLCGVEALFVGRSHASVAARIRKVLDVY